MSENTGTPEPQVETTSVFRADLLKEMENGANGNDATAAGTDNLAEGQAPVSYTHLTLPTKRIV